MPSLKRWNGQNVPNLSNLCPHTHAPQLDVVMMMTIVKTAHMKKFFKKWVSHAAPFHISRTFCGQNMCRILIKICAEYCSIFHEEYSRAAGNFANTSALRIGRLSPSVHQPCASTRHRLWHHHKVQRDKRSSLTPISKSELHTWPGFRLDFLINVCSSGTNISMSENIWILRKWENLDNRQKRTYLFHVLSQSKFGPLISSLQDFTSIQISRYIKITMLVPLQKYQFCRRGCRKHSLVHSWQGLVG